MSNKKQNGEATSDPVRRAKRKVKNGKTLSPDPNELRIQLPVRSPSRNSGNSSSFSNALETFPDSQRDEIGAEVKQELHYIPKRTTQTTDHNIPTPTKSPRFRQFTKTHDDLNDLLLPPVVTLDSLRGPSIMAKLGKGFYGKMSFITSGDESQDVPLKLTQTKSEESGNKKITTHDKTISDGSLTQFTDYNDPWVQSQRQKVLEEVDKNIEPIISSEGKLALQKALKKKNLIAASSEFFLATISGPNYVETTRCYKENVAARAISTYPVLADIGRAGEPIADFYYVRVFGSATVLALSDGCNWGEAPKQAACLAASSFVRYVQDRLHLCINTRKAAGIIINGFAVAHDSILRNHRKNIWNAGSATLLGAVLVPVLDSATLLAFRGLREEQQQTLQPKLASIRHSYRAKSMDPSSPSPIEITEGPKKKTAKKMSPRLHRSVGRSPASTPKSTTSTPDRSDTMDSPLNPDSYREAFNTNRARSNSEKSDEDTLLDDSLSLSVMPELDIKTHQRRRSTTKTTFQVPTKRKKQKEKWALMYGNVGDCKVFVYSWKKQSVTDVTYTSRHNTLNASDCGGRLGPYLKDGSPDMRNFCVSYCNVRTDDLVIVVSDGVHDNLDPQYLGVSPRELHINEDDWELVETNVANLAKRSFREKKLLQILQSSDWSPKSVCDVLVEFCRDLTEAGRRFMEEHPSEELPPDYATYPGKMDHTSVICIKVDSPGSDSTKLLRNAFSKKEQIYAPGQITKRDLERATFN